MGVRVKQKLTSAMAKQAKKPGYLSDGGGLVLQITKSGSKSWLFRYRAATGKIREMGLGSFDVVTLADARRKAADAQRQRAEGQDPIGVKRERELHARVEAAKGVTFKWCAEKYIASNAAGWSNAMREMRRMVAQVRSECITPANIGSDGSKPEVRKC